MILYYALGGGLGHLMRARRVIERLGLAREILLLGVAEQKACPKLPAHVHYQALPEALARDARGCGEYIRALVVSHAPRAFYVDSFPGGVLGELRGLDTGAACRRYLIARALRWEAYRPLLGEPAPVFDAAFVVEPLEAGERDYIERHCARVETLDLSLAADETVPDKPAILEEMGDRPLWLVAHSGPDTEVGELIEYAYAMMRVEQSKARLLVVSLAHPRYEGDFVYLGAHPARAFFPHVARIITACGFNTLLETEAYREKHYFMPFPRRYDDQFARAARYRAGGHPA